MDNLIEIMKIFALGCLIWAGVYGIATLICANAPRKQAEAEDVSPLHDGAVAGALFDCASFVIEQTAAASVGKLEQILGKDLRERVKKGQADKKELYALAGEAFHEVCETVSPEIISALKSCVKNTDLYIQNVVEAELLKLKSGMKA